MPLSFVAFKYYGQPAGHDNFNYIVGTWQHKFTDDIHTKTEGYFMWQRDAVVGGTPSIGPVRSFGGGGRHWSQYSRYDLDFWGRQLYHVRIYQDDFITFRNEYWRDVDGERSGFPGTYSSHAIGLTHNFTKILQIRPEIGYYRNWNNPAFDNGKRKEWSYVGLT